MMQYFQKLNGVMTGTEDWRGANVTPLFKKGSREDLGSYKPVSLTSVGGEGVANIS